MLPLIDFTDSVLSMDVDFESLGLDLKSVIKKHHDMKKCNSVEIMVYPSHESSKPVFGKVIDFDDNLVFPFNQLCSSLRFLYGNRCVIKFKYMSVHE